MATKMLTKVIEGPLPSSVQTVEIPSSFNSSRSLPTTSNRRKQERFLPSMQHKSKDESKGSGDQKNKMKTRSKGSPVSSRKLNFHIEDERCAVYIENIGMGEDDACENYMNITYEDDRPNSKKKTEECVVKTYEIYPDMRPDAFDCEIALKSLLRERINATFDIPIQEIGIRSCTIFSIVTNFTETNSSNDNDDSDNCDHGPDTESNFDIAHRIQRAACVEFKEAKIAKYALALTSKAFFSGRKGNGMKPLRIRRWKTRPKTALQQNANYTTLSNPITTSAGSKSIPSANEKMNTVEQSGCKSGHESRKKVPPTALNPSMILVTNIPFEATSSDIYYFFQKRMKNAFPSFSSKVLQVGIRSCHKAQQSMERNEKKSSCHPDRIEACVMFQDHHVAKRATLLKSRRWHKPTTEGDSRTPQGRTDTHMEDKIHRSNGRKGPMLGIKLWDRTKYDVLDFVFAGENSSEIFSEQTKAIQKNTKDDNTCGSNDSSMEVDLAVETSILDVVEDQSETHNKETRKSAHSKMNISVLKEQGFLTCVPNTPVPRCAHVFSLKKDGGIVKRAQLCRRYHIIGKFCCQHTMVESDNKCPFVHINSIDELSEPHDILALLYWVHNNEELDFVSGHELTPEQYLQKIIKDRLDIGESTTKKICTKESVKLQTNDTKNVSPLTLQIPDKNGHAERSEEKNQFQFSQTTLSNSNPNTKQRNEESDSTKLSQDLAMESSPMSQVDQPERDATRSLGEHTTFCKKLRSNECHERMNESFIMDHATKCPSLQEKLEMRSSRPQRFSRTLQPFDSWSPETFDSCSRRDEFLGNSWPQPSLKTFLEKSVPTLMEMTRRQSQGHELECNQQRHQHYQSGLHPNKDASSLDCAPSSLSLLPCDSPSTHSIFPHVESDGYDSNTNEPRKLDLLQVELSSIKSQYGTAQIQTSKASSSLPIVLRRMIKLPVSSYATKPNCLDIGILLSIPMGYPSKGIISPQVDVNLSFLDNKSDPLFRMKDVLLRSLSNLERVCRWEAECCEGNPALQKIMHAADVWVENDWMTIFRTDARLA